MSGHNKWSSIKHRKGAQDAKRGKLFTKLIKEITVAARAGGGDPDGNPRLRRALDIARTANMPADNIQRAIKKGTGELEGVQYEELLYEGVGSGGALFLMTVLTDNRNRTAAEVRKILEKHGGSLGSSGSAAWAFEEYGVLRLPAAGVTEERLFELAADAGAEDLQRDEDSWVVLTPRHLLDAVRDALDKGGLDIDSAGLEYLPKTPKTLASDEARSLLPLYDALDDHDDVQQVFVDFEVAGD
ncbi:MAG: YebC/PmpR family DNA-binding transcriptional regulator [Polyangiales bacterium]